MKNHSYHVSVEERDANGCAGALLAAFDFDTHDDLNAIIAKLSAREGFDRKKAEMFGLGLKLFAVVTRSGKTESPFREILPHLDAIMKEIKK